MALSLQHYADWPLIMCACARARSAITIQTTFIGYGREKETKTDTHTHTHQYIHNGGEKASSQTKCHIISYFSLFLICSISS